MSSYNVIAAVDIHVFKSACRRRMRCVVSNAGMPVLLSVTKH
jgi:hypothetical protein